jgi:alkaline phosphatase D|tara:strand:- start:4939 stop:6438 length:1500 start_codon:yes stop_codon:yes gene_type:complete
MKSFLALLALLATLTNALSAGAELKSGPMIGAAGMYETIIWLQTSEAAEAQIRYWPSSAKKRADVVVTDLIQTSKDDAFVAKISVGPLIAGATYGYEVVINGKKVTPTFSETHAKAGKPIPLTFSAPKLWRYREGGHKPFDYTLGFGSCAYVNDPESQQDRLDGIPYGGDYQVFESIYEKAPDAFIWLGDTLYLNEGDWTTSPGIYNRWTRSRALPELAPLLATTPHYFTWDDHEFGPNDIGSSFWNKAATTEAFELFTANPSYGLPETPGIFSYFNHGDANIYLLDNRTYRTEAMVVGAPYIEKQMLGKAQVDWLVNLMAWAEGQRHSSYPASFHIVCVGNQVISPARRDNLPRYEKEWQYLFDRLMNEDLNNVIFVTGDVHFGEVSKLELTGGGDAVAGKPGIDGKAYTYYDITTSSLTAGSFPGFPAEENPQRYDIFEGEADRIGQRNFMLLRFTGEKLSQRQVAIEFYDTDGNLLNQKEGAPTGTVTDASILKPR